jgi:hypothetical protein
MPNKILPSSPADSDSFAVVRKIIRCDECASRQAAVCSVELQFFCVSHFVDYCYRRLAEYERALSGGRGREAIRGFLRQCATQAAKLLLVGKELQNADRARLFDIMLWSNELFSSLLSKFQPECEQGTPALTGRSGEPYFTVGCRSRKAP